MFHIVLPRKKDGTRKVLMFMGTSRIRKVKCKTVTGINVTGCLIDCAESVKRLFRRRHIRIMGKRAVIDTIGGGAYWAYNFDADCFRIMASEKSRKADIKKAKISIKQQLLYGELSDNAAAAGHAQSGGKSAAASGGGSGQHVLTASEIEEIKAFAVNGMVPISDYIRIATDIINRTKAE